MSTDMFTGFRSEVCRYRQRVLPFCVATANIVYAATASVIGCAGVARQHLWATRVCSMRACVQWRLLLVCCCALSTGWEVEREQDHASMAGSGKNQTRMAVASSLLLLTHTLCCSGGRNSSVSSGAHGGGSHSREMLGRTTGPAVADPVRFHITAACTGLPCCFEKVAIRPC